MGKNVEQYLLGIQVAVQNASTKTDMAMHSKQMETKKMCQTLKASANWKQEHCSEFSDGIGEVRTLLDSQIDKLKELADDANATKEAFMNTLLKLAEELR